MNDAPKGPILIDLDAPPEQGPDMAPPVPDLAAPPAQGRAMQAAAVLATRKPSRLSRWFWGLLVAFVGAAVSVAAWDFAMGLVARQPVLGWAVTGLGAALLLVALIIIIRELAAFSRLARIDRLQHAAREAALAPDLAPARAVIKDLTALYAARDDLDWHRDRLSERLNDVFDAPALIALAEAELMAPLDARALQEVEAAARQVATVTALVPLAMADVVAALTSNIRMIRRVAEVYGGRSGMLGSWRLTRAVMTHLVATGAVAMGDDMIGSFVGGGVLGKLSRRFGEGVVNGALTARVGVAAMEVCRPVPFTKRTRPSVTATVKRALTGLFSQS